MDPLAAVDCLLDARIALQRVAESTLAGTPLHGCLTAATAAVDSAIVDLRKRPA
jgi:hypothetical protein